MKKLHVGCGPAPIPGWINTDINPLDSSVMYMDAASPWPFQEGELDYVFSEHLIEHLTFDGGVFFLREAHRCLKPGGRIRIATPNIKFLFHMDRDWNVDQKYRDYAKWSSDAFIGKGIVHPVLVINNFFRDWGHQFLWDPSLLRHILIDVVKFSSAFQCCVSTSGDPNLSGLEQHGKWIPPHWNELETMVFEAAK
jgi:predicted SAM-dependent methyltransferase